MKSNIFIVLIYIMSNRMEHLLNYPVPWDDLEITDKQLARSLKWNKSSWKRELKKTPSIIAIDFDETLTILDYFALSKYINFYPPNNYIDHIFGCNQRIKLIKDAIKYQQSKGNIVIIVTNNMVDIVYKCLQEIQMDVLIPKNHIYGYQTMEDPPLPNKGIRLLDISNELNITDPSRIVLFDDDPNNCADVAEQGIQYINIEMGGGMNEFDIMELKQCF